MQTMKEIENNDNYLEPFHWKLKNDWQKKFLYLYGDDQYRYPQ